jgi:hypothetical protein
MAHIPFVILDGVPAIGTQEPRKNEPRRREFEIPNPNHACMTFHNTSARPFQPVNLILIDIKRPKKDNILL